MVHVYIANVENLPDPKEAPEIMVDLPEERKQKILRYRQEDDRKQSLGAGLLLKHCLKLHDVELKNVHYGFNGKPEIDGICFNLSHSENMAVCAISNSSIGCDIEKIRDIRENIAERFFTEDEIQYLNSFEKDERRDEFFRLWTMKESYMKMTGEGMSLALDRVEFVFDESVKVYRDGELCSCMVKEYDIPGYKMTVCSEEEKFAEEIVYFDRLCIY